MAGDYETLLVMKNELEKFRNALKDVEISNFPEDIKINNFGEIRKVLSESNNNFLTKLENILLKMQPKEKEHKSLNITPEYAAYDNVKSIFNDLKKTLETLNLKDFAPKFDLPDNSENFNILNESLQTLIETLNKKEFNPQINVETPTVNVPEQSINFDLSALLQALGPLKYLSNKPNEPISVRMSDGKKFIEALKGVAKQQEKIMQSFSIPSSGMTSDEFKLAQKQLNTSNSIVSNRKAVTTAGTAEKLVATSTTCTRVDISADLGNTNPVVIGGADVVATAGSQKGIVLVPANPPVTIFIDDVSKLYVDAQTSGDGVCFNYYNY